MQLGGSRPGAESLCFGQCSFGCTYKLGCLEMGKQAVGKWAALHMEDVDQVVNQPFVLPSAGNGKRSLNLWCNSHSLPCAGNVRRRANPQLLGRGVRGWWWNDPTCSSRGVKRRDLVSASMWDWRFAGSNRSRGWSGRLTDPCRSSGLTGQQIGLLGT
jgi:hypothetical protein